MMLRVIDSVFLYSAFGYETNQKEAMGAKIMISRIDHTPEALRQMARKHKFRDSRHRMRAIALVIEDRLTRAEIARRSRVGAQTLCDWVHRYNARGLTGRPSGRPSLLGPAARAKVASWLDAGPDAGPCAAPREDTAGLAGVPVSIAGPRLARRACSQGYGPGPGHGRASGAITAMATAMAFCPQTGTAMASLTT